jgi:hypothetical protein
MLWAKDAAAAVLTVVFMAAAFALAGEGANAAAIITAWVASW